MTWTKIKMGEIKPSERSAHASTFVPGSSVYIHGGFDGSSHLNDMYIFDMGICLVLSCV